MYQVGDIIRPAHNPFIRDLIIKAEKDVPFEGQYSYTLISLVDSPPEGLFKGQKTSIILFDNEDVVFVRKATPVERVLYGL